MNLKEEFNNQANNLAVEINKRLPKKEVMNDLAIFKYQDKEVRTLEIDNELWIAGTDVASILGYSDTSDAIRTHVEEEDKLTRYFAASSRNLVFINESGLYTSLGRSCGFP